MLRRSVILRIMLWSLALAAVAGVVSVLAWSGTLAWRMVGTGLTTAIACALLLPTSALVDRAATRPAGLLGMGGIIFEFLLALTLIWEIPRYLGGVSWEGEIAGTMGISGLAIIVLMGLMDLREKPKNLIPLGMGGVIFEFLLALMLIWEVPRHLWGVSWEGEIAATIGFSAVAAIVLMGLMALREKPGSAIAARVGVLVTLLSLAAYLLSVWLPDRHPYGSYSNSFRCGETGSAIALFGGLAVATLVGLGIGIRKSWRWVGLVASVAGCALWLIDVWIGAGSDLEHVAFCTCACLAVVIVHANLSFLVNLKPEQCWVRTGTIGAAILTASLIDAIVIDDKLFKIGLGSDVIERYVAAAGIVTACGTLALLVLARLNRRVDYEPLLPELSEITVVCPRCRKKQSLALGDSACPSCSLRISIRIEDPRCPQCDYVLYGLTSDRCPECGTVIGDAPATQGGALSNPT